MNANCARMSSYPRHLGRQIARALQAYDRPLRTAEMLPWAYPRTEKYLGWHYQNIRRHCRMFGLQPVGTSGRSLLWALRKLDD